MRWTPGGQSSDIEDRRGSSGGGLGIGGAPIGIGGAILLLVLSLVFHKNFFALLGGGSDATQPAVSSQPVSETPAEHQEVEFITFVLNDIQKTWETNLPNYRHAKLVLFRDAVDSACGLAQAASGPFYCPQDEKVYLDIAFFEELQQRFKAGGDFAQAYVIAHEVGHHVQKISGIEPRVRRAMQEDPANAKQYSVRLELQADCLAGVWGHSTNERKILESGDVEEGLNAAAAVGDDRIQHMTGRRVNPESFTHGSAQERASWFRRGFESGKVESCNTFER
jgi:predicted metalloprotease